MRNLINLCVGMEISFALLIRFQFEATEKMVLKSKLIKDVMLEY